MKFKTHIFENKKLICVRHTIKPQYPYIHQELTFDTGILLDYQCKTCVISVSDTDKVDTDVISLFGTPSSVSTLLSKEELFSTLSKTPIPFIALDKDYLKKVKELVALIPANFDLLPIEANLINNWLSCQVLRNNNYYSLVPTNWVQVEGLFGITKYRYSIKEQGLLFHFSLVSKIFDLDTTNALLSSAVEAWIGNQIFSKTIPEEVHVIFVYDETIQENTQVKLEQLRKEINRELSLQVSVK